MQAFVTGGSGFVGSKLIIALRERNYTVKALARSEQAALKIRALGAEPIQGDLNNLNIEVMRGCDVVFHAAASLNAGDDVATVEKINFQGTRNLLDAARSAKVPRFVHVSAASVLANGAAILKADETRPIPNDVVGPYSRTKAKAEKLVLAANRPEFATVAVRPPMIWGLGDNNILPSLLELIQKGRFVWFSHGQYPYVTCNVINVCEGTILAAEKGRGGESYFLTDGEALSFRKVITDLLQTQNVELPKRSLPLGLVKVLASIVEWQWQLRGGKGVPPTFSRENVALLGPLEVSDAKARKELGYRALLSREDGLAALRNATHN